MAPVRHFANVVTAGLWHAIQNISADFRNDIFSRFLIVETSVISFYVIIFRGQERVQFFCAEQISET